jgi:hypothetical protein
MEKILIITGLVQRIYSKWLFQHLLFGVIIISGLIVVIAIMVSALLIGSLMAVYFILLSYGIGQTVAIIVTAVSALLVIMLLIIITLLYLQHLRKTPKNLLKKSPLASSAKDTLDSFIAGLMAD